jgi:hypothetical protein
MSMKFKPREVDIKWARNMMEIIQHKGILVYPDTRLIYMVDHKLKKLVLQNTEELLDAWSNQVHERTKLVFKEIGYAVEEKADC